MSLQVFARGTVFRAPERVESDDGETVAAFVLADGQFGRYGDQVFELDLAPVCEIVLRGDTAVRVLATLRSGDPVLAFGLLRITVPVGVTEDADLVSLSLEAYSIGTDLAVPIQA